MMDRETWRHMRPGDDISDGDNYGTIVMCSFGYVAVNWHGVNPAPLPPVVYAYEVFLFLFGEYTFHRGGQ